jgi:hypothetical protein
MPAARPILFSTPMIRALLDGRKTQTRRIMKPPFKGRDILNLKEHGCSGTHSDYSGDHNDPFSWGYPGAEDGSDMSIGHGPELCPYGRPGDLLWVREGHYMDDNGDEEFPVYAEDEKAVADLLTHPDSRDHHKRRRPSIHMPRWASRLTLEITDVRAQRLQDITEADALAEGIPDLRTTPEFYSKPIPKEPNYGAIHTGAFCGLWCGIHGGVAAWDQNPWVWALTFKVHQCNVEALVMEKAA